jgi:hypothetical protein
MGEVMIQLLSGPHAGLAMYEADDSETMLKPLEHWVQCRWNCGWATPRTTTRQ